MFKSLFKYGLLLTGLFALASCNTPNEQQKQVVAQVETNKLYLSDVGSIIPNDVEKEDSTLMAEDYIKKWIKRELLLLKAEENLNDDQKDVSKQIEEYRKSLIIYKYKNAIMNQRMDTTVTDDQIFGYFQNHPERFRLNKNIVKAIYIKIPNEVAQPERMIEMCRNNTTEGINELRDYSLQFAKSFDNFNQKWVDFELVAKNIPQTIENPEQFLQANQIIERNDSSFYYLVFLQDYKLINESAPLEYAKDDIKNLILNRRKIDFLKQLEDNVYSEGIKRNKFKMEKLNTNDEQ